MLQRFAHDRPDPRRRRGSRCQGVRVDDAWVRAHPDYASICTHVEAGLVAAVPVIATIVAALIIAAFIAGEDDTDELLTAAGLWRVARVTIGRPTFIARVRYTGNRERRDAAARLRARTGPSALPGRGCAYRPGRAERRRTRRRRCGDDPAQVAAAVTQLTNATYNVAAINVTPVIVAMNTRRFQRVCAVDDVSVCDRSVCMARTRAPMSRRIPRVSTSCCSGTDRSRASHAAWRSVARSSASCASRNSTSMPFALDVRECRARTVATPARADTNALRTPIVAARIGCEGRLFITR